MNFEIKYVTIGVVRCEFKGDNLLKVYHGTDDGSAELILQGIDLNKCNEFTDNAKGFYVTTNRDFALNRAEAVCKKLNIDVNEDTKKLPVVVSFDFDESLATRKFACKSFSNPNTEWKYFVFINRLGTNAYKKYQEIFKIKDNNLDFKYDIVFDPTADSGIAHIVDSYRYSNSKKTKQKLEQDIDNIDIGKKDVWDNQISFHSDKALVCLKNAEIIYE